MVRSLLTGLFVVVLACGEAVAQHHDHGPASDSSAPAATAADRAAFDDAVARIETALVAVDLELARGRMPEAVIHASAVGRAAESLPELARGFDEPRRTAIGRIAGDLAATARETAAAADLGRIEEVSARATRMRNFVWTLKQTWPDDPIPAREPPASEHAHAGHGIFRIWDLHPSLVHFPIAFLLAAVFVDLWCRRRPSQFLSQAAASLFVLGAGTGVLAAGAGVAAILTAPRMADPGWMVWAHPAAAAATLALFAGVAAARWRRRLEPASSVVLSVSVAAALFLFATAWLGADLVYRHGFGVTPESHGGGHDESPSPKDGEGPHDHA